MDHERNIIRYLDGEMNEDEVRRFEEELAKDAALAGLVAEIERLQKLAGRVFATESDPETELDEKIRQDIRKAVQAFRKREKRFQVDKVWRIFKQSPQLMCLYKMTPLKKGQP